MGVRCAVLRSKDVSVGSNIVVTKKIEKKCTLENFKFFFNPSALTAHSKTEFYLTIRMRTDVSFLKRPLEFCGSWRPLYERRAVLRPTSGAT